MFAHVPSGTWANIIQKKDGCFRSRPFFGAGNEARTRYLHLGKVALYRMSYARTEHFR